MESCISIAAFPSVSPMVSRFQRMIDSVIADNDLKQMFAYLDNITIGGFDKADHDRHFKKFLNAASN